MPCTYEHHEALRADPVKLRHHTEPSGVQYDDRGVELFELRHHLLCGSTLACPVEEGVPIHVDDVP